jgi:hypothetical protein
MEGDWCGREELGGPQMDEPQAERLLRHLGHGLEEYQGHLRTNDGGGLQELFLLRRHCHVGA